MRWRQISWRIRRGCVAVLLMMLGTMVVACETSESPSPDVAITSGSEVVGTSVGYRVVMTYLSPDTLHGRARFGPVYETGTGRERFVIRLASGFDDAGGFIIVQNDTVPPAVGSYAFGALGNTLELLYREGMLRNLRASSGMIRFTTVTDTLVAGTFEVDMRGPFFGMGAEGEEADVRAMGWFRAEPGLDGLLLGL